MDSLDLYILTKLTRRIIIFKGDPKMLFKILSAAFSVPKAIFDNAVDALDGHFKT